MLRLRNANKSTDINQIELRLLESAERRSKTVVKIAKQTQPPEANAEQIRLVCAKTMLNDDDALEQVTALRSGSSVEIWWSRATDLRDLLRTFLVGSESNQTLNCHGLVLLNLYFIRFTYRRRRTSLLLGGGVR